MRPTLQRETAPHSSASDRGYPDNPVLVRLWRGQEVESQHRGAWVVCDANGKALEGDGQWKRPIFTRSSVKCLQALPLLETGAAERYAYDEAELALALASHNGERMHVEGVARVLERLGLSADDLQCGAQAPSDPTERNRLRDHGEKPCALHNNCSGKHAGFLALGLHLGVAPAQYLDPQSSSQQLVKQAVLDMTGLAESELGLAIDGCSAPTFRMPLTALATAFARVANPHGLAAPRRAACERMLAAVAAHPAMIAGNHERICTDIARVTKGRLFPKVGGEAVYAIGIRGQDRALAIKIDDGSGRALHAVILGLLRRFKLVNGEELAALAAWAEPRVKNWAGLEVGRIETLV